MKGSAKGKCLCCGEFYPPDHRNVRHQRYCSKPACRKESKAQSQRRWQQRPENQNYFCSPENCQRVKDWRKRNPGYWRKKKSSTQGPLQEVFQRQVAHNEELIPKHGLAQQRYVKSHRILANCRRAARDRQRDLGDCKAGREGEGGVGNCPAIVG